MPRKIEIWYHDENEVDERHSWLRNSPRLIADTERKSYDNCSYSKVLALVEYARPDFILTVDGEPLLSVEVTEMNPSGHNLPQRYSCLLRAAELGVPSLFYYPEYSRRSTSDPNPRYLNIRTPLAQLRMGEIYGVPSLSMFWPTDPTTLLPTRDLTKHLALAQFVEHTLDVFLSTGQKLDSRDPEVQSIESQMKLSSEPKTSSTYSNNTSFRFLYPNGDDFTRRILRSCPTVDAVDPPSSCRILNTKDYLVELYLALGKRFNNFKNQKKVKMVLSREYTFIYKGVANKQKTGPEHPYPGYLTLLDILYLRVDGGQTTRDRKMNLAFELPITVDTFKENAINRPTGLNILMEFSDFIILDDAIVLGGWMRNIAAGAILVRR